MARQLNIRSDEAYKIAHRLAKRRGQTVTAVVTDALRQQQEHDRPAARPEVPPEQSAETIRMLLELSERSSRAAKPGSTSDHSYLYDEHGLPK
jgi:antitoxin VapB